MSNNTSPHILNTSVTLLGFCMVVITSVHISNQEETLVIDGLTSLVAGLLTLSCILSFVSLRSTDEKTGRKLERVADFLFLIALAGVLFIILLIALNYLG